METIFYCPFDGTDEATSWPEEIQDLTPDTNEGFELDTANAVAGSASLYAAGVAMLEYSGINLGNPLSGAKTIYVRMAALPGAEEQIAIGMSGAGIFITATDIILQAGNEYEETDTYTPSPSLSINTFYKFKIIINGLNVSVELEDVEILSVELSTEINDASMGVLFVTSSGGTWFDEWTIESGIMLSDVVPPAEIELVAHAPSFLTGIIIPSATATLTARVPSSSWTIPARYVGTAKTVYKCILTGANDGVDDIVLPISSFQARIRNGEPTYLSCVIPDSVTYTADILARTNGEIIIQKGFLFADGSEQYEEITRVTYESVQINRGARSDSATLTGHKTVTLSSPKEWTVSGVSFYGLQADGKRRIRCALDMFLKVGDICIYGTGGGDYFTVGQISCWVSAKPVMVFMEVQEA